MRRILVRLVLVVVLAAAAAFAWLALKQPAMRPASTEKIEATPERLARGEYLVEHVADCLGCHSDYDFSRFALPLKAGTEGQGGYPFDKRLGVPGMVQAQNITSDPETGIGAWTDGEVVRAIREGVDRRGKALFPMMPYDGFRDLGDEDVKSIVAYIRRFPPIRHSVAPRKLDFPVNFLVKFAPKPVDGPVPVPDPANPIARGRYLTTIAGCRTCHTPTDDRGRPLRGTDFSGGYEFRGPWGRVVSANITPEPGTYIGRASREEFIGRFKSFESLGGANAPIAPAGHNTVMVWPRFAGMTSEDLGAIYDYLKTVQPIRKKVEPFPDAKN